MKSKSAQREFERYLRRAGHSGLPSTPSAGIEAMSAFYSEVRAQDVDLESNGDMLLFQWGAYDWGRGELFEVDITRQFIRGRGDDQDIWQLHLTYRFEPLEGLRLIGKGNRWCAKPADVPAFASFIRAHAAIASVGARDEGRVTLEFECAG